MAHQDIIPHRSNDDAAAPNEIMNIARVRRRIKVIMDPPSISGYSQIPQ
jgi:hypothetical protein